MSAITRRKTLKLILMSATISTDKFALYLGKGLSTSSIPSKECSSTEPSFSSFSPSISNNITDSEYGIPMPLDTHIKAVPVLFIPGYTFPITEFYKNEYESILRGNINFKSGYDDGSNPLDRRIGGLKRKGDVDYDLLIRLIVRLSIGESNIKQEGNKNDEMFIQATGSILIFMPGVPEINKVIRLLESIWESVKTNSSPILKIMPLHGNLSPSDQKKVFDVARRNELKIVFSTNVAEASVTLPDVTVVIDSCRVKEMDFDVERQMKALIMKKASKDSLRQRKGRAGRVQAGRCFRLITFNTYESLSAHSIPEMLRAPLENLVLQVKAMNLTENLFHLLSRCPDPPLRSSIVIAENILIQIQALDQQTAEITSLGRHLSTLPCDPKVGRLLVYGALLGCTYAASAVGACLTNRSPFIISPNSTEVILRESAKTMFSNLSGCHSDHTAMAQAVQMFDEVIGTANQKKFCAENGLYYERMLEIRTSQKDLLEGLVGLGLLTSVHEGLSHTSISNRNRLKPKIIIAVVCVGLYPSVGKIKRPPLRYVDTQGGKIEKNINSKELNFYILKNNFDADDVVNVDEEGEPEPEILSTNGLEEVYLHSSSINATNVIFKLSNFILYTEKNLGINYSKDNTGGGGQIENMDGFLHDISEVSPMPLLLFGGKIDAQYSDGTVSIDKWIKFIASKKIIKLIFLLRNAIDQLLYEKINNTDFDINSSKMLEVVCHLLATDGV